LGLVDGVDIDTDANAHAGQDGEVETAAGPVFPLNALQRAPGALDVDNGILASEDAEQLVLCPRLRDRSHDGGRGGTTVDAEFAVHRVALWVSCLYIVYGLPVVKARGQAVFLTRKLSPAPGPQS
jgi:hypothetical protein